MKKALLNLLVGLALALVPAQATPVVDGAPTHNLLQFEPILLPVTAEETPEWAKLPNVQAWYEIRIGIMEGGISGMLLVLRGLLVANGDAIVMPGFQVLAQYGGAIHLIANSSDLSTPEPSSLGLLAAGFVALGWMRFRK
jgi:hypothetical protein